MKRVESGQGATDFGALNRWAWGSEAPGITEVFQEVDNLRECIVEVRAYVEMLDEGDTRGVLSILEKHGL